LDRELPAALAGHVARLRRANRNSAHLNSTLPPLIRGAAVLRMKFVQHLQNDRFLIMIEEIASAANVGDLTSREREILEWIGQGKSNVEIAVILGISTHTVKRHVERILSKLGVENRYAAALVGLHGQ
jgi:DNA-binding CsgD family transcriptional regulator